MKLLVLYQARDAVRDHPGHYDGFERLVREGALQNHAAIPFRGVAEAQGWEVLWRRAEQTARATEADAVFLQFFHEPMSDPAVGISRLRALPQRPTVFSSLGDPFGRWDHRVPPQFRRASALSDVTFLTGMGHVARQLERAGARNLVLMPNGCCQVRFSAAPAPWPPQPDFDVAFVGSRIRSCNPAGHFFWTARRRRQLVEALSRRYGVRFGLFGHGWEGNPSWQGPILFDKQQEAYRRSAVIVGGMPHGDHDYYQSNRVFIAIASAVPLVDYWVNGVERILSPGLDWWLARSIPEMIAACDRLLALPPSDRHALGMRARQRILASHTQYDRCRQMLEIVRAIRAARLAGKRAPPPRLSFLQGPETGAPPAIVAWEG